MARRRQPPQPQPDALVVPREVLDLHPADRRVWFEECGVFTFRECYELTQRARRRYGIPDPPDAREFFRLES